MAVLEPQSLRPRGATELGELGELVANGASRAELVAATERALGCRIRVVLGACEPDGTTAHPIAPGTEVLGTLRTDVPEALSTGELVDGLAYAARVIGIELIREQAARETRWSLEADLLVELVEAGPRIPERLRQRARHAGFDLDRAWHVILLEAERAPMAPDVVAAARRPASSGELSMTCTLDDRLVVAVCDLPEEARDVKVRHLHRLARGLGVAVRAGVSSSISDFACGVRQAEAALRLATCARAPSTMYHEDLGSLRFLLNGPNQRELLSLVQSRIAPLVEHDRERQTDLLQTLRVFLDEGGNRRRTAERCHVHLSTVKYRVRRIRELLDCDLGDADVRFDLMLALKVLDLLRGADSRQTAGRVLQVA